LKDEVVQEIWNRLKVFDVEEGTIYSKKFTKERIKEILKNSLDKIDWNEDTITEENYRKALQAFGVIKRKRAKTLRFEIEAEELKKLSTKDLKKTSLGIGSFRRGASVFFDEDALNIGKPINIMLAHLKIESQLLFYSYNNREKIRKTNELKGMVLRVLNFLIEKGSVIGYMLREDIL